ncbi:butyrophilin-like protein 9 isoform X7 [Oenanthe melanoleuca]|uniref:butyrophilin-like protein 9 isoform X7 n=1 Tax=Oenanthe melanoleuca TaxID=2939378 RepID=UPI0024C0F7A4|nr:butyrophilin-like protein 9 isoform X7 [Oenanthe melanoleuca]
MGSGMGSGIPTPLLLLLLSVLHPIIGNVPEPLLVLEGRDRAGIRLRCVPERPFPQIRLLWSGAGGENLTGIAEPEGSGSAGNTGNTGSAGISLLLRPGSGNAASCRALDPQLGAAAESSVVIADVFFPGTSPWVAALALLLLLALSLALAAALRLRRDNQILAQERKSQQQIQEEIEELRMELEEEMGKFQRESQDMAARIEQIRAQLDFRRAQSHAVSLTLDERCHHPSVAIQGRSLLAAAPGSGLCRALAVAREGFSSGKHYWEVELGLGHGWELGVLAEEIRDSLRSSWGNFPEAKAPGLQYSRGEFRLPGGKLQRNSGRCRVLGVLLDQERRLLSFFDAEEKQRLGSVPLQIPGNLFPFFSPGSAGNALGIRPVGV